MVQLPIGEATEECEVGLKSNSDHCSDVKTVLELATSRCDIVRVLFLREQPKMARRR